MIHTLTIIRFCSRFASPGILLFIQETVPLHEKLHVEDGRIWQCKKVLCKYYDACTHLH